MWYRLFNLWCYSSIFFCLWAYGFYNHDVNKNIKDIQFSYSINAFISPYKSKNISSYLDQDSIFSQFFYENEDERIIYGEVLIKSNNISDLETPSKSPFESVYTAIYYVNTHGLKVDSSLNIQLFKGSYDFYILFDYQGIQYAARSTYEVKNYNNEIHFKLYPVLGDAVLNVRDVKTLASYKPRFLKGGKKPILARELKIRRLKDSNKPYAINSTDQSVQVYMNIPKEADRLNSVQVQ